MRARLLTKAAMMLLAIVGLVAVASENDSGAENSTKSESQDTLRTDRASTWTGRNPRVLVITSTESPECQKEMDRLGKAGGEFSTMRSAGWKIGTGDDNHIQIIDRSKVPEILKQVGRNEFPVVACVDQGEVVRSFKDGCSTPLDAWTFGWMMKGVSERPQAAIPEAIRVTTTGHYPLRGNHWSIEGLSNPTKDDVIRHLREPQHAQFMDASYKIEEWSVEELKSLHDDLHEKYGPAGPVAQGVAPGRASSGDAFSGSRKALGK